MKLLSVLATIAAFLAVSGGGQAIAAAPSTDQGALSSGLVLVGERPDDATPKGGEVSPGET
jgi:hypothetical protein